MWRGEARGGEARRGEARRGEARWRERQRRRWRWRLWRWRRSACAAIAVCEARNERKERVSMATPRATRGPLHSRRFSEWPLLMMAELKVSVDEREMKEGKRR